MASSESIVTSSQQQTTTTPPTSIVYATTTTNSRAAGIDDKAKTSPSAASTAKSRVDSISDEEWDEEYDGKLVIDLGTDNDSEKKESAKTPLLSQSSSERNQPPVRNNNNNNSHNSNSPTKDKNYNSPKASLTTTGKSSTPFSTSSSTVPSSKNGSKTKSKKSNKSSTKHHNQGNASYNSSTHLNSGSFRTSSPTTGDYSSTSSDITSLSSTNKHSNLYTTAAEAKTSAVFTTSARSSSSPDDVTGKKSKSSKSGRSHHKKHKHDKNSGERSHAGSGSSKGDEKGKSKSKQHSGPSSHHSIVPQSSVLTLTTTSSSPFTSNHSSISSAKYRQSSSPGLTAFGNGITSHVSNKYPTQAALQGRTPTRTAAVTGSDSLMKSTHSSVDKEASNNLLVDGHTSHHNRKKPRKSLVSSSNTPQSTQTQLTSQPMTTNEVDPQRFRGYNVQQHLSPSVVGKRDRNGSNVSTQPCTNDNVGSKKIKLDQENKDGSSSMNEASFSTLNDASKQSKQQQNTMDATSTEQLNPTADVGKNAKQKTGTKTIDSAGTGLGLASQTFQPSTLFSPRFNTSGVSTNNSAPSTPQNVSARSGSNDDDKKGPALDSQRSVGTLTMTSDVGVMTEPDNLGPCEPGTSVHLDGIVWHETDTGVLVVNVTWRNRTYVGTLLDATKHDWAPPRLSDTDLDMELRVKNGRPKRQRGSANESSTTTRKGRSRSGAQAMNDDVKGSPSTASKRRGNKNSESESAMDNDGSATPRSSAKRARIASSRNNITQQLQQIQNEAAAKEVNVATTISNGAGSGSSTCSSPVFIDCPHPNCNKRYRHINGLKYHQSHAHLDFDGESKDGLENKDDDAASDRSSRDNDGKMSDDGEMITLAEATEKLVPISPIKSVPEKDAKTSANDPQKMEINEDVGKKFPTTSAVVPSKTESANFVHTKSNYPSSSNPVSSFAQVASHNSDSYSTNSQKEQPGRRPVEANSVHNIGQGGNFSAAVDNRSSMEVSAADSESAMAVQTLLQLQPQDDQFLPGLTAPYSQDSPPPTLSLASRPTISQMLEPNQPGYGSQYQQQIYSTPKSVHTVPSTQEHVAQAVEKQPRPTPTSNVDVQNNTYISSKFSSATSHSNSTVTTMPIGNQQVMHGHPEQANFSGVTQMVTKENYAPSASSPVTLPSGNKMAKGKLVQIPSDPNHGVNLPVSNTDVTSPGSNSAKKQKRKKKLDHRNSNGSQTNESTPERRRQSNDDDAPQNKFKQQAQTAMESNSPHHSAPFPMQPGMVMPIPNPHLPKPQQNNPLQSNDQSSVANVKSEPGTRPPQQHFSQHGNASYQGRKVPGVVMPISSAANPGSNNITVKGTFVPHPDPHHPQTAVSAQTQDRLRATRNPSPTNTGPKSNLKPPSSHSNNPVRNQPEPKPRNTAPVSSRGIPPEMQGHVPHEHDPAHHARVRHTPDSKLRPIEHPDTTRHQMFGKLQDRVDSTIANAYNSSARQQQAPRSKPPTPLPEQLRQPHEAPRPRPPTPNETRIEEHRSRPHTPPHPRPQVLPGVPTELRDRPGSPHLHGKPPGAQHFGPQAQAQAQAHAYLQQLYYGRIPPYGIIAPSFDHGFDPHANRQQYEYFQELHKQQQQQQKFIQEAHQQQQQQKQQQHLQQLQQQHQQQQQQQQQLERKIRKENVVKDITKVEFPHKQNSPAESTPDKHAMWPAHHAKRHSTGSLSPFPNQAIREKHPAAPIPNDHHPSPSGPRPRYNPPQPNLQPITPTQNRSHSVVNHPALPPSSSPSVHGIRPEMRRMEPREDPGVHQPRKQITPPNVRDRSPEKPKDGVPPGNVYRSPAASPGHLQFYPAAAGFPHPTMFDHARPPFRGFAVPGFPPGYVYQQPGAPIYPAQAGWPPGGPIPTGKQSPPLKPPKERSPSATRSPREEIRRPPDGKPKENPSHFSKERRAIEAIPARKISRSPDPKQVAQPNVAGRPLVPKSPPTQHHTHTHHHIHEGIPAYPQMITPSFPYTGSIAAPVIAASSEGVVPFPQGFNSKRE